MILPAQARAARRRYREMAPVLNEQSRRRFVALEAQALGRPVVVNAVGVLSENVLTPPRMPEHLRTGWVVRPGDAGDLARGIMAALSLSQPAADALGARARQFAEFMFSPQSVAVAIRGVYTALLSRGA